MEFERSRAIIPMAIVGLCLFAVSAWGAQGKISGYYIGEYYYLANSHSEDLKDRNGFQFRRIYFTYDQPIDEAFSIRLRFEMNSASFPDAKAKLAPFVKNGYLRWKKPEWRTNVYFGLVGTPTFSTVEKVWGYRSVAKTLLDMQKLGSSTDFGVAAQGNLDEAKKLSYHVMFGNGSGTSGETNADKEVYASLTARPVEGVIVEAYGDFHHQADSKDRYTVQGFAAYQTDTVRGGVQVAHQTRKQGEGKENLTLLAGSVFGAAQIIEGKLWALARVDRMFDPNPSAKKIAYTPFAEGVAATAVIAGIDWTPVKSLHLMPNVFVALYDAPDQGNKPDADIMPRLTAYFKF